MPRKHKDPAAAVIDYFKTADPAVLKTVLAIAEEIVRERSGPKAVAPKPQTPMQPRAPRAARPTAQLPAGPGPAPSTVGE